jgi:endonuclease-3 related protein
LIVTMPTLDDAFPAVRAALVEYFGRTSAHFDHLDPFEAMVAVLLDRTIGGPRGLAALEGLRDADLMTPDRLVEAAIPEIIDALGEKGVNAPARSVAPLKHLARWLVEHHGGRVASLSDPHRSTDWLRGELAAINGIGAIAADALLLYALKRPSYPVDRATFRVLVRHAWLDPTASYDEARDLLVDHAAREADMLVEDEPHELDELSSQLADLAHGMAEVGRRFCRVAAPHCDGCPLERVLPEGGPRDVDA